MTEVIKKSGEVVRFSKEKLRNSLIRSGADGKTVSQIMNRVRDDLYQGIPTQAIYDRAFAMLLEKKSHFAAKYRLKKAIYELGPTGFPFEEFISALLTASGYQTEVGVAVPGICVSHEVDVWAVKEGANVMVECKFHSEEGLYCNVKIPLYIHARFNDIQAHWTAHRSNKAVLKPGWVVTNTRFSQDALRYGRCVGLYLLSWDTPKEDSLKQRIDRLGLYPVTVSTLLTHEEKQGLLDRKIVLCRQVLAQKQVLQELQVSPERSEKICDEMNQLCISNPAHAKG